MPAKRSHSKSKAKKGETNVPASPEKESADRTRVFRSCSTSKRSSIRSDMADAGLSPTSRASALLARLGIVTESSRAPRSGGFATAHLETSNAEYLKVHGTLTCPYASESDFIDALYKPHTLTALVLYFVGIFFFYLSFRSDNQAVQVRVGAVATCLAFGVFGIVHLPDGILTRPHPVLWRLVLSFSVLFMLLNVFLLFVDEHTARALLKVFDPSLGKSLPERDWATDCRLSTKEDPYKWFHTIFDEFVFAHAIGYFAKMLIFRDWRIVTALSVLFELVEVSLQHILPNFKECWWDHIIADLLVCNAGGTLLGHLALKWFGIHTFNWVRVREISSVPGKMKRILSQFLPRRVDPYEWGMFSSWRRFVFVFLLLTLALIQEVNSFTAKNILRMTPTHPFVIGRLVLYFFTAVASVREIYEYAYNPNAQRFGTAAWVCLANVILEFCWITKYVYLGGHFRTAMPLNVKIPLIVAFSMLALWYVLFFFVMAMRQRLATRVFMNALFYGCFAVLGFMFLMTNVDIEFMKDDFLRLVSKF